MMREAVWTELLKARRSRLPWITAAAFAVAAGVGGLFMFILEDPDRARAMGLLGTKAQLAGGTADWPGYLAFMAQMVAVGGVLIFGIIVIWTFGREFSDHTAKDLLALPTARGAVVMAKFVVTAGWCLLLSAEVFALGLLIGTSLRLPHWSTTIAAEGLLRLVVTTAMTVALVTTLALAASLGRGYLAAVGVMFVIVFVSQVVATLGYGHLFPWSVPAVYSGLAGPDRPAAGLLGYTFVAVVGAASVSATVAWWTKADHPR
jgi:ABC-2 type transport system permease protein